MRHCRARLQRCCWCWRGLHAAHAPVLAACSHHVLPCFSRCRLRWGFASQSPAVTLSRAAWTAAEGGREGRGCAPAARPTSGSSRTALSRSRGLSTPGAVHSTCTTHRCPPQRRSLSSLQQAQALRLQLPSQRQLHLQQCLQLQDPRLHLTPASLPWCHHPRLPSSPLPLAHPILSCQLLASTCARWWGRCCWWVAVVCTTWWLHLCRLGSCLACVHSFYTWALPCAHRSLDQNDSCLALPTVPSPILHFLLPPHYRPATAECTPWAAAAWPRLHGRWPRWACAPPRAG